MSSGDLILNLDPNLFQGVKEVDRITGPLLFDSNGDRRDVRLELIRFQSGYWAEVTKCLNPYCSLHSFTFSTDLPKQIGEWTHSKGINIENAEESKLVPALDWLKTNKLKVIVAAVNFLNQFYQKNQVIHQKLSFKFYSGQTICDEKKFDPEGREGNKR